MASNDTLRKKLMRIEKIEEEKQKKKDLELFQAIDRGELNPDLLTQELKNKYTRYEIENPNRQPEVSLKTQRMQELAVMPTYLDEARQKLQQGARNYLAGEEEANRWKSSKKLAENTQKHRDEVETVFAEKQGLSLDEYRKRNAFVANARHILNPNSTKSSGFFQAGGFSDGVDGVGDFMGDLAETATATVADAGIHFVGGVSRGIEGIFDLGMYGIGQIADWTGADDVAADFREAAQADVSGEMMDKMLYGSYRPPTVFLNEVTGQLMKRYANGVIEPIEPSFARPEHFDSQDEYHLYMREGFETEQAKQWDAIRDSSYIASNSVLGDKADSVFEGLGQVGLSMATGNLAGAAGMGQLGVTAVTTGTTGLSAMGHGMTEAYLGGATDGEAWGYGAIAGLAEAGTELLFGGMGKGTNALGLSKGVGAFDDIIAKKITSKITNHTLKTLTQAGIKSAGESLEEFIAGTIQGFGKWLTYRSEDELNQILEDENLLDQAIQGFLVSAIAQSGYVPGMTQGGVRQSIKNGTDFITGFTQSDEQVIDKLHKDAIAKQEADGKTLTKKEKNELYDNIVGNLETGQIEIDDIESILGGEEYTAYKDYVDNNKSLKDELAELQKMKSGDMNDLQTTRMNELKGMNLNDTTKRDELRAKLDNKLSPLLQNSKLNESYNERAKRGQAFQADLSQFKGKQRAAYERAMKSGVLNNTYKSHKLVETLSQIEADKGIEFDYTNNDKLKELGYSLDGVTINGFEQNGKVTLNVQSAKAWQTVVGHEIAHVLEGTDAYAPMQEALFKFAESKGELASRRADLAKRYKNVKGANIDAELTADLVGDYLFNDKNFIRDLTGNKPLFKKIYDEIKYLYKHATGKQLTEIEKVKREFDKAWKELKVSEGQTDGKVNLSVSADSNGNELGVAVQQRFANSKAVDENGRLKVLYHGTASGEFTVFDKAKGSVEGDFGSGFYFTDSDYDVSRNYEGGGPDFENKIDRRAEQIESEEGIDYIKARKKAIKELFAGSHKFEVYLNIENPAVVGETNLLNYESYAEEYDRNDYDSDEDYEGDVEQLIADDIDQIIWDVNRNVDVYSTDGLAEVLWNAVNEGGIGIEQLKAQINDLYLEDSNGNLVGNEVTRQIIESLGYDGIIDPTVSSKFNMEMEGGTTHYIVFKPNQIKNVSNQNPTDNPDINLSLSNEGEQFAPMGDFSTPLNETALAPTKREPIISKLTGREISEQTYATMDRLQRGDVVALEELNSLPEVIEGEEKVKEYTAKFLEDHPEFKDVPSSELGTHLIDSAEREQMRNNILQERLNSGSFTGLDSKGNEVYNGSVEKGKRLDIVIGLPAAGKSTSIVNPLSEYYKSVVVDSDIIKGKLPEFNDGWGASLVHEESSNINAELLDRFMQTGSNIVLPIVGSKVSSVEKYLTLAKDQGYEVHLHLNELNSSKAMGRMLGRYFSQGRFIPPAVSWKYGDKPTSVYEEMKNRGDINGYSHWNNDVQKGQRPTLTEADGSNGAFSAFSGTWRASRGTNSEGSIGANPQGTDADFGNGVGRLQMGVVEDAPTRENSEGSTGLPKVFRLNPTTQEALNRSGVVSLELVDSTNDSNAFSIALNKARSSDEKNGWAVTPKTAEELVEYNIRTIMTSDSKAGLGVAPDGDIEAVFKNPNGGKPRVLDTLIPAALEMGGNKLDCYGEGLVDLYARYGFIPVARVEFDETQANEGWTPDKGTPYIFFMYHNGNSADTVVANKGTYKKWTTEELNALPLYGKEDYGAAYAYRDSLLPEDIAPVKNTLSNVAPLEDIAPMPDAIAPMTEAEANAVQDAKVQADANAEGNPKSRKQLHSNIINDVKATFSSGGLDFDDVLSKAKNLSTFSTVDNTPQRVMEKALGYKGGQVLADLTVNKVAQNETKGIKWLNSFTDRKSGLLAQISKQYNIKPGSKESAAAQMYAEGFYVNDADEIVAYGDAELAQDFPDAKVRNNIKGLAQDPRIRQIYDETLAAINESRARNAYPEIQKLDNYFLHFRAMEDTFSKLGLPFNPNDIRAKDLPTDLNGVTADLKPGQPYFASAMHRKGKRTSFDLLGGLERYLTSAKNQIYHIDDIQTLRALRNYIADTYGQAQGLENIDMLTEEEAQERIKEVYGSHLSTFAKFLNEEANVLAGKTALIDRGLEGVIGRRGMTFLDTVRKQTGTNMVGYNISSSLTNFIPVAQTVAKTNKFDFLKAFTQTVSNKLGSIVGKNDGFAENSPVMIRRKGADRFYRTPFQKVGDTGYAFMGIVDNISTELIARTKFNELTRKGMSEQQAHIETDKWVSRLMGDRSLGQMPQLYNSKTLGVITQFQLEVRNQLDSQFYDTIQEAKVSSEDIENGLARNAKKAAKITSTFVQLAVAQHLFGKAFESIAGYNPAFDIISVLATLFGFDDEEDSEDTFGDNAEQAFLELLGDLPYTSTFTDGGRIPISSALPIKQLVTGKDEYGNEKSRWETLGEVAPYYILPTGYGQIKKTTQGLGMFNTDEDHPIAGSYTDSGNLRFPVEDTFGNRVKAAIFGQYANENAREYFDNDYAPLKEKQIQEYIDVDMPIKDYWEYREGLSGLKTNAEKADYINSLDISNRKKNLLMNNILDRKEDVDMSNYDDFANFEEFDYATKNPEKYEFFKANGISYKDYANADEDGKAAYTWAYNNPDGYALAKAVAGDVITYRSYTKDLYDIKADKDAYGKSINGSRKNKVLDYINNLDADYETKIILYKSEYPSDDTYNQEIIEYINNRNDLTYEERIAIYTELGFTVKDGYVYW